MLDWETKADCKGWCQCCHPVLASKTVAFSVCKSDACDRPQVLSDKQSKVLWMSIVACLSSSMARSYMMEAWALACTSTNQQLFCSYKWQKGLNVWDLEAKEQNGIDRLADIQRSQLLVASCVPCWTPKAWERSDSLTDWLPVSYTHLRAHET